VPNTMDVWNRHGWIRPAPSAGHRYPATGYNITRVRLDPMVRELALGRTTASTNGPTSAVSSDTTASSQMWFLGPDMAYTFGNEDGLTVLTVLPGKHRLPEFKADLEASFMRSFEGLPRGPRLDRAERVSKIMGKLDLTNIRRRPAAKGMALIGDAALASDPLWGVGCGWAFQSAEWLVGATAEALQPGPIPPPGSGATGVRTGAASPVTTS
jgi:hypothetical protein